jgi:RimJ/RimL family protein N-acetyltransferase
MGAAADVAVALRAVEDADLDTLFEQQRDPEARRMAAFGSERPDDRDFFDAHWSRIRANPAIDVRAIVVAGAVAGHVVCFERFGLREVGYWLGRAHWGKGIATRAVREYLARNDHRPLYARVAKDNAASIRVLEKCGFAPHGEDRAWGHARGGEVEEFVYRIG